MILSYVKEKLFERGVHDNDSMTLKRQKAVFNALTFFGSLTAIPQIIALFPYDTLSSFAFLLWGVISFFFFLFHDKIGFELSRDITLFSVFILGGFGTVRLGPELYPHVASLGLFFAVFIFYDFKKNWAYLLLFTILEIILFILTEFSLLKVTTIQVDNAQLHRTTILCGTLIFVVLELYLFKDIISRSEIKVIKKLRKSNEEKDILLKEVHHRVKNNLQLLSSLIRLRSNSESNEIVRDELNDINSRIRSIALLHNKVYLSESIQNIDFAHFANDLINEVKMTFAFEGKLIVKIDSDLKEVDLNNMVPMALILNELITNSFKHGIKNNGELSIEVQQIDGNKYQMFYGDNGAWKEPGSDSNSMGLSLIDSLSEQLDGSFEIIDTDHSNRKISHVIFTIN
jgi:two-component sensor histidine kinase